MRAFKSGTCMIFFLKELPKVKNLDFKIHFNKKPNFLQVLTFTSVSFDAPLGKLHIVSNLKILICVEESLKGKGCGSTLTYF